MLSDLHARKATYYFTLIDEDGNGIIEVNDFALRAQRLVEMHEVTDEGTREALRHQVLAWWDHVCKIADFDGDARVTLPEWKAYWNSVQRGVEREDNTLETLHQAARSTFRVVNQTGTGRVTEAEYHDWLAVWGVQEYGDAFGQLDRGGKGFLTEEDVVVAVQEFYLSDDPAAPGNALYGPLPD